MQAELLKSFPHFDGYHKCSLDLEKDGIGLPDYTQGHQTLWGWGGEGEEMLGNVKTTKTDLRMAV